MKTFFKIENTALQSEKALFLRISSLFHYIHYIDQTLNNDFLSTEKFHNDLWPPTWTIRLSKTTHRYSQNLTMTHNSEPPSSNDPQNPPLPSKM